MRPLLLPAFLSAALVSLVSCGPTESEAQRHHDANTPAGKIGKAAHAVAVQADKAGQVIGRQLGKAAHDAHEGWKEAARNSNAKR